MRGYLLDTNIVTAMFDELNSKHTDVRRFLQTINESSLYISTIVLGEIKYGYKVHENIDRERKQKVESRIKKWLNKYSPDQLLTISRHTADEYASLRAALFKKFGDRNRRGLVKQKRPESLVDKTSSKDLGIQENDLWLAAQALERNLTLVTNDRMIRIQEVGLPRKLKLLRL